MMGTTHAAVAVLAAAPFTLFFPEYSTFIFAVAVVGGLLPDLDIAFIHDWFNGFDRLTHRRALHYPEYFSAAAAAALVLLAAAPSLLTVTAAVFLLGAALHSVMDVFGAGLERFPWEGRADRAVYRHGSGSWVVPRRWVAYDGSPGDFLLLALCAMPLFFLYGSAVDLLIAAALLVSAVYVVFRKQWHVIAPEAIRQDDVSYGS